MVENRKRVAALVAVACSACVLAVIINGNASSPHRIELTFWDGAAADEPGYAEEASQQIDTGLYGYHLGYWEEPGYWNNRGFADGAESQMDMRMFDDAAQSPYFQTGGADFFDTNSLYNDATDADSVSLDGTYDNAWPGTGGSVMGYDGIESSSDAYDGQWEVDPLDSEAASDASVSGNDIGGFKAVGGPQSQMLTQLKCDRCYGGADCVAGCRVQQQVKVKGGSHLAHGKKRVLQQKAAVSAAKTAMKQPEAKASVENPAGQGKNALATRLDPRKQPAAPFNGFGGLAGFNVDGLRRMSRQGLMCGEMACATGGLWGKACGCSPIQEIRARETQVEEQAEAKKKAEAAVFEEKREEAEEAAEAEEEDEEKQKWLGLHGIVLDSSPLAERWMPEQHNDLLPAMQDWKTFWSKGHKMKNLGVKV